MSNSPESHSSHTAANARYYRPELDSLRFFAFLLVYLTHTLPSGPGTPYPLFILGRVCGFGVPLFFTLSAYLITELITRERRVHGSCNIRAFYMRRILRIWPLYITVLALAFALSRMRGNGAISTGALVAYLLFSGNWYSITRDYLGSGAGPLWSISVEEQFYLLWPWLAGRASRRTLLTFCVLAWSASQACTVWLCLQHLPVEPNLWLNSIVHLQYFALGASISLVFRGATPSFSALRRIALFIAACLCFYLPTYLLGGNADTTLGAGLRDFVELLFCGGATSLLLLTFLGSAGLGRSAPVRYLGRISYGLYVYHLPVLLVLEHVHERLSATSHETLLGVIALPCTVAVAALSYLLLERPFLRLKRRFELVPSRDSL